MVIIASLSSPIGVIWMARNVCPVRRLIFLFKIVLTGTSSPVDLFLTVKFRGCRIIRRKMIIQQGSRIKEGGQWWQLDTVWNNMKLRDATQGMLTFDRLRLNFASETMLVCSLAASNKNCRGSNSVMLSFRTADKDTLWLITTKIWRRTT